MKANDIIDQLLKYCFNDKKTIKYKKCMFDDYQIDFLDGFIEVIINQYIKDENYEVYLCIKTKEKIGCPLLYKNFTNIMDAKTYYEKLKKLIKTKDEKFIVNCCKIGL